MKAATKGLRAERVAMAREREREFERHGHMVSTRMKHATVSAHSAPHPYRRSAEWTLAPCSVGCLANDRAAELFTAATASCLLLKRWRCSG